MGSGGEKKGARHSHLRHGKKDKSARRGSPNGENWADMQFALVGNANVGKSVFFNQLTGLEQTIGNWPGKTVERAEGPFVHHGLHINLIDLPGIYSLSTYSIEELVSREYLAKESPDAVINVVDATSLERNLYFTIQLLEMGLPLVIALNQMDLARKKGIEIDTVGMERLLGVPVVPMAAVKGEGVHQVVDRAIEVASKKKAKTSQIPPSIRFAPPLEKRIEKLERALSGKDLGYPSRWLAIKLLEGDQEIVRELEKKNPSYVHAATIMREEIKHLRGQDAPVVCASERYASSSRITNEVLRIPKVRKVPLNDRLDDVLMHPVGGYLFMIGIMVTIIAFIAVVGGWIAVTIETEFESLNPGRTDLLGELLWKGGMVGFYGALGVVVGFILPFYIILGFLEDSGYIPRAAFLMDRPFHPLGLHGKAAMPLLLGFGCSVPACVSTRIMERRRDRFIAAFLATLVPCSARTAVILGLVGAYVGVGWAVFIYVLDLAMIVIIGRLLNKMMPGRSVGLIMELPNYRKPSPKIILKQTWARSREFVYVAFPLIIVGSLLVEGANLMGWLDHVTDAMSPVTEGWLLLPAFTGILLIFGVLRKEAALVLLATVAGTSELNLVMTPVQMVVFALVITLYVPCIATIAVLVKEFGWKGAMGITLSEIGLAILVGGIAARVLVLFM